ncbi:MAG TPA: hypothetical protein EYN11_03920 [Phycisphaerales bacterium]|nr:hypothetical protein [Phycisphaerales bacterium]
MNKQTRTIATLSVGTLLISTIAAGDLQGVSIDSLDTGFGGFTTYRVYVDVDSGNQVDAIFGDTDNPLTIRSSTTFYQNQFGLYSPPAEALFGFFPCLEFDSFVSIGLLTDTNDAMLDIGIDWTDFESNGGDIYTNNGTWFATPDDAQVMEVGGRVLIGQFTTDGNITGEINISGKNADLTSWQYTNVALPAPGALAILGLAGYLGVRRRR